jgi:hypothetical protein
MPITPNKLRVSSIALAALVGASLLTVDASAARTSMPSARGCRSACCKASQSAMPNRAAVTATVGQNIPSPDRNACRDIPGCNCRPQSPTAPEPKERRDEESGPDPGRTIQPERLDIDSVFRPFIGPVPPTINPPLKSPLYLRNSRLLI